MADFTNELFHRPSCWGPITSREGGQGGFSYKIKILVPTSLHLAGKSEKEIEKRETRRQNWGEPHARLGLDQVARKKGSRFPRRYVGNKIPTMFPEPWRKWGPRKKKEK